MHGNPHRWVVLSGMIGVYFAFGVVLSSIAPMINLVRSDLGASRGEMGLALGAWALIFIVTAPLAGRFVDRFGLGLSVSLGGLSVALSALARSEAQSVGGLWLAVAIFGVGGPLISSAAPTLVHIWFDDEGERRKAVGMYVIAPAVGGVSTLALTNPVLLPAFGTWRDVLLLYSLLALVATAGWIALWVFSSKPPAPELSLSTGESQLRGLFRSSGVRFAFAIAFTVFFVNHALSGWMPAAVEDLGDISATASSSWLAVAGVVGIAAALMVPRLTGADRQMTLFNTILAVVSVGLVMAAVGPSFMVPPGAVVTGIRAALVPLGILFLMEADGVDGTNSGLANGLWFSIGEIGGVSGPFVVGTIADTSLGFSGALLVVAAVGGLTAVTTSLTGRHRRPGSEV